MQHLFTPARIGTMELENRFIHSATYECMAGEDGSASDSLIQRYRTLARGQVALIIPGYMFVEPQGRAAPRQTGIHSDDMLPGLRRLCRAVHDQGAKIVFQLVHAGRQTKKSFIGEKPIGPSATGRDPAYFVKPREMTEEDISRVIRAFSRAAARAVEAGADGVQLHGAHGYLISQFLSPFFNRRTDEWGGSLKKRSRFLEAVFWEVKESVPQGFPLLVKLNAYDHTPQSGVTPREAAFYAGKLAQQGIDGVEVSCGTMLYSFMNTCRGDVPVADLLQAIPRLMRPMARPMLRRLQGKFDLEEAYNLGGARVIKSQLGGVPLLLVGGMRSVARMEAVIQEGYADFISMSRPFVREPFLVKRIREGRSDRAACISCNRCFGAITRVLPLRCFQLIDHGATPHRRR